MTNKMMVLFASAALTLVACSDKDSGGDDSGATDGTDSSDSSDGTDGGPVAVSGGFATAIVASIGPPSIRLQAASTCTEEL